MQIFKFCKKLYMRHTIWSCLIRCINMKWINQWCSTEMSLYGHQEQVWRESSNNGYRIIKHIGTIYETWIID